MIATFNWQTSFIVTGALGIIWAVFWLLIYRDPERHASVTPEQLSRLQGQRRTKAAAGPKVPWSSLFRYQTIWGLMIGFFCVNFVFYFFITWFPTYLVQARGFSLAQLGTLGLLPALAAIPSGWLGGLLSDRLYRHGWSLTAARKTCLVGGMLMSSVITLSAFAPNAYVALLFFVISSGSLAVVAANIWSLPGDVAPTPAQCGLDRRHSERRLESSRHRHDHLHRRHAHDHRRLVYRAACRGRILLRSGRRSVPLCGG